MASASSFASSAFALAYAIYSTTPYYLLFLLLQLLRGATNSYRPITTNHQPSQTADPKTSTFYGRYFYYPKAIDLLRLVNIQFSLPQ